MNLDHLYTILRDATFQLRKGPVLQTEKRPGLNIHTIENMPHEEALEYEGMAKVDCELLTIAVDKAKAEERKAELIEILKTYPQPARLAGGPSYIEIGAEIGDQGAAFQLFALGEVLGLWRVVTPTRMGMVGAEAREMAARGFVMISGWTAPK